MMNRKAYKGTKNYKFMLLISKMLSLKARGK